MHNLELNSGTILVVDDSRANLQLLSALFHQQGYRVRAFTRGKFALVAAEASAPDLILLDINMPEMDGYELCRRLKEMPKLAAVPVLFLSTLSDPNDKVRAFQAGGVDYVTKQPFHPEEVLARVGAHIRVRRLQQRLEQQNLQLKESYDQLRRLEELRDKLIHMVIHDLRSPMTVVGMSLNMLKEQLADGVDGPSEKECIEMALSSNNVMISMVNQLLDISRLEAKQMPLHRVHAELVAMAKTELDALFPLFLNRHGEVCGMAGLCCECDAPLIRRVLNNLLGNALKFTPDGGSIVIRISLEGGLAHIEVSDTGPGIPSEMHERIFEKFGQVEGEKAALGTGLGLPFCRLAVEAHGGRIGVRSELGKGSIFWFELPLAAPSA